MIELVPEQRGLVERGSVRRIGMIEGIRLALARYLGLAVQVVTRREWDEANGPDGRPTRLVRPLSPLRGVEDTGMFISAVVRPRHKPTSPIRTLFATTPPDPNAINIDSHDWILDLPADPVWSRTVAISGLADTPELRTLVREHVFGVPTIRVDHHHLLVPDDIARATPNRAPTE
jgi:hypothetical protein